MNSIDPINNPLNIHQAFKKHVENKATPSSIEDSLYSNCWINCLHEHKNQNSSSLVAKLFKAYCYHEYETSSAFRSSERVDQNNTEYKSIETAKSLFQNTYQKSQALFYSIKQDFENISIQSDREWARVFFTNLEKRSDFLIDLLKNHLHSEEDLENIWDTLLKDLPITKISNYFKKIFQNYLQSKGAESTHLLLWILKKSSGLSTAFPAFDPTNDAELIKFSARALDKSVKHPDRFVWLVFTEVNSMEYALFYLFEEKNLQKIAHITIENLTKLPLKFFGKAFSIYPREKLPTFLQKAKERVGPNMDKLLHHIDVCLKESHPARKTTSLEALTNMKAFNSEELLYNFHLPYFRLYDIDTISLFREKTTEILEEEGSVIIVHNPQRQLSDLTAPSFLMSFNIGPGSLRWQVPLIENPQNYLKAKAFVKQNYTINLEEKFARISFPETKKSCRISLSNGSIAIPEQKKLETTSKQKCSTT